MRRGAENTTLRILRLCTELSRKQNAYSRLYSSGNNSHNMKRSWTVSDMPNAYQPKYVEGFWLSKWSDETNVEKDTQKPPFTILLPPPNVTGSLHLGHALTISIQDALIRWNRMSGKDALWIPGTDHAGIATQVVVEKKLQREQQVTRHQLGREQFLEHVWDWKENYGNVINTQIKRMGAHLDWSREYFTMDEKRSAAVVEAFKRLYRDGLIYRDMRMVSWCCHLGTAISDIEVDQMEVAKKTYVKLPSGKETVVGVLYTFTYTTEDGDTIPVSTTRPETILGDVAVAIHPDDERYKHLHGKFVVHPFDSRRIPIVCDSQLVDMSFGTGAVKVTPGHDPSDLECAKRNNLPIISIMHDNGTLNEKAGVYQGMDRFDARKEIVKVLKSSNSLVSMDDHKMVISKCSRSGDILEPLVKPQWYVKCGDLARNSLKLVDDGVIKISPTFHTIQWVRWLENIHDWCISRQLWWGHRIPAYRVIQNEKSEEKWVVAASLGEAEEQVIQEHGLEKGMFTLQQDDDVLDTWFSSALLPLSSLGWPAQTDDLKKYYPTSVLETGSDILFFWVARMVMLCTHLSGQPPFETILLHPVIRDSQGRKMSKSLGNVIDPIHVIEGRSLERLQQTLSSGNLDPNEHKKASQNLNKEFPKGIEECGTDALRFALISYLQQDRQINLDINRVVSTRHFCNKIWNAAKFILSNTEQRNVQNELNTAILSLSDRWILSRLKTSVDECNQGFCTLDLSRSTTSFYNFFMNDLCDVYLELSKVSLKSGDEGKVENTKVLLSYLLSSSLRLLHPLMPMLSEELWHYQNMTTHSKHSILLESYPKSSDRFLVSDMDAESDMKIVMDIVEGLRSLKQKYSSRVTWSTPAGIIVNHSPLNALIEKQLADIGHLSKLHSIEITTEAKSKDFVYRVVSPEISVYLQTPPLVEEERAKIEKKIAKLDDEIKALESVISSDDFQRKANPAVLMREKKRFEEMVKLKQTLLESL